MRAQILMGKECYLCAVMCAQVSVSLQIWQGYAFKNHMAILSLNLLSLNTVFAFGNWL